MQHKRNVSNKCRGVNDGDVRVKRELRSNVDYSKLPLLTYAKRKLAKDDINTSCMSLADNTCILCVCCGTVALFSHPTLCFACVDRKTRKCSEGSDNIYYVKGGFVCFEHAFRITAPFGSTCGGHMKTRSYSAFRKPDRTLLLPILHKHVISKILQLILLSDVNRDVLNLISIKLTEVCAIHNAFC